MMMLFGLILVLHGVAHLVGFLGSWQLVASIPYQTTILAGTVDVGDAGIRIVGLVWLSLGLAFAVVGTAAFLKLHWWPAAAVVLAAASLFMCVVAWPAANAGAALNLALLVTLFAAMRFSWLEGS